MDEGSIIATTYTDVMCDERRFHLPINQFPCIYNCNEPTSRRNRKGLTHGRQKGSSPDHRVVLGVMGQASEEESTFNLLCDDDGLSYGLDDLRHCALAPFPIPRQELGRTPKEAKLCQLSKETESQKLRKESPRGRVSEAQETGEQTEGERAGESVVVEM